MRRIVAILYQKNNHPSLRVVLNDGGKGGIRTHGTLLRFTAFPVLPVQPLLHLSAKLNFQTSGDVTQKVPARQRAAW